MLWQAIFDNNIGEAKLLLQNGIDVNGEVSLIDRMSSELRPTSHEFESMCGQTGIAGLTKSTSSTCAT